MALEMETIMEISMTLTMTIVITMEMSTVTVTELENTTNFEMVIETSIIVLPVVVVDARDRVVILHT